MRILQLVPRFTFPTDDGGKIGITNIYKEFYNQGCEVTYFAFYGEKLQQRAVNDAKKYGDVYLFNHSIKNTPMKIALSLFSSQSLFISKCASNSIRKYLLDLIGKKEFDIIHCDHSSMAPLGLFLKKHINKPVGLRLHNIEWIIWERYMETLQEMSAKKLYLASQVKKLKKDESIIYPQADVCFAITEPDRKRALEIAPKANVVVASAGVNTDEWKPDEKFERNPNELIIATTYDWIHNVEGVNWLIDNIMPELKMRIPKTELTLIGKNAPDWLRSFKYLGVNVVGYVPKVQPYLNRAGIYVAPLFVGGGIRIKILEAMAMALPVVATPVAAEGITANESHGLFVTDNKEEFIKIIKYLMRNPGEARVLGDAAREFIIKEYSWKKNVGIMVDEYRKLMK